MKIQATPSSLKQKSKEVTKDCTEFCEEFKSFVKGHKCMSLTAAQVGKFIRVIAVKNKSRKKTFVLVNPSILSESKKKIVSEERTLDKVNVATLKKMRPLWVVIQYQTPDLSKTKKKVFLHRQAAAACHALDILDGNLR